jgi:hypothetical protein
VVEIPINTDPCLDLGSSFALRKSHIDDITVTNLFFKKIVEQFSLKFPTCIPQPSPSPKLTFKCVNDGMFNNNYGTTVFFFNFKKEIWAHTIAKKEMKMTHCSHSIFWHQNGKLKLNLPAHVLDKDVASAAL